MKPGAHGGERQARVGLRALRAQRLMSFDTDSMLKPAVKQIGADAELVGVQKVKREGPWLLDIEQRGAVVEAVLKAGAPDRRSDFSPAAGHDRLAGLGAGTNPSSDNSHGGDIEAAGQPLPEARAHASHERIRETGLG